MGPLSESAGAVSHEPGPARAGLRPALLLAVLCALGALARVAALFMHGPLHPDEFFQYLEPAWVHLTGVGIEAWEFRDGLRSWVLPFYNGAWLAAFMAAGVKRGELLVLLVQVQTALLNSLLIWFAYRGGASCARQLSGTPRDAALLAHGTGFAGGTCAAFLSASFPYLIVHAGHTLSEQPSMLALLAGLVEISELSEQPGPESRETLKKAALGGLLLSLSACLRIANGPLVLIAPLYLLITRRLRAFSALALAALALALAFALVDLFTWGEFAHSYVAYLKFNLVEGKAANFGTAPWWHYLDCLWKRAPVASPLLLLAALLGLRRNFLFMVPLLSGLLYLSTQPHKEDRFVLFVWPLLFTAAGGVLGAAVARAYASERAGRARLMRAAFPLGLALLTPLDGAFHLRDLTWLGEGRFLLQTVVSKDPTLTGLMIDGPIFAGGALWLGRSAPNMDFDRELLKNPLISHVLVESDSKQRRQAEAQGFQVVTEQRGLVIMRR